MQTGDEKIIARFLEGESEAVCLIDEWINRAASPFHRRLSSEWEDLLQAVRLQVTRLLHQGAFRGDSSLKTYIWRVTNHTCIDHIRAQERLRLVDLDDLSEREAPPAGSPLERFLYKESEQILLQVLEEMPAECRKLWAMILEGRSYKEMGQKLGMTEGALRVKVMRCRKKAVEVRNQLIGKKQSAVL
ncbi:MAG: sigma-70 family RNA polymerase sigma factor [Blastocatellia bacterium]|nr:sigma-70 family RNA polymerase sigma factor [Blastocatellia bacterium]